MQLEDLVAEFSFKPLTKVAAEQWVIAIPTSVLVERRKQQLMGFHGIEELAARSLAGDRLAKWCRKAIKDCDPEHELDQMVG